jgi:hypothetical protein
VKRVQVESSILKHRLERTKTVSHFDMDRVHC